MYIDIIISIIMIAYAISGLIMGFFVEFIGFFGMIGSFFFAAYLTPSVIKISKFSIKPENYISTYIFVLVTIYIILLVLKSIINNFFKSQVKGITNRIGGIVVGLLKGIIVSMIIITAYKIAAENYKPIRKYSEGSKVIKYYYEIVPYAQDYLPEKLRKKIEEFRNRKIVDDYLNKIL